MATHYRWGNFATSIKEVKLYCDTEIGRLRGSYFSSQGFASLPIYWVKNQHEGASSVNNILAFCSYFKGGEEFSFQVAFLSISTQPMDIFFMYLKWYKANWTIVVGKFWFFFETYLIVYMLCMNLHHFSFYALLWVQGSINLCNQSWFYDHFLFVIVQKKE